MRRWMTGLMALAAITVSGCSAWDAGAVAVGVGAAYWIVDPRAPNWNVKTDSLSDTDYRIELQMKNFVMNGQGEARMVFKQAAQQLAERERSPGYEILTYEEGVNSEFLGGRSYAVGLVRLRRAVSADEQWMEQTNS